MARTARTLPVENAPAPWPEVASEDKLTEIARAFVLRLKVALGDESIRAVAARAGMSHVTVLKILGGRAWPDLATIARLELALDTDLYSSVEVRAKRSGR
ncbi:helix-turn-helix transcriptional regulator [Curtobacterium flaccumfaciens]|uniref:helix-turn-helix transcriptional regulator n=1 Tax=Curtobacterium flaccumfaciens TaxID=2035 RepID=UPI0034498087